MSKQFKKYIEDEDLFNATKDYVLDIERPLYKEGMSLQDYGALCIAFDELKKQVSARFDGVWREGTENDVI